MSGYRLRSLRIPPTSDSLPTPSSLSNPCAAWSSSTKSSAARSCFPFCACWWIGPGTRLDSWFLENASPALLRQSSESLAGRIAYHELPPFRMEEVGATAETTGRLWLRGGFPRSFLAKDDRRSFDWRSRFMRTFLERDLPQLGVTVPATTMRRFWTMVAHYHGNVWHDAELARALSVTAPTIRTYLDTLVDALIVRRISPWYENLRKRQIKAPKAYVADSGLLHAPPARRFRIRACWDTQSPVCPGRGLQFTKSCTTLGYSWGDCYYWATHGGAELDLLVFDGTRRIGFEFKRTSSPGMTRSMHSALGDLRLDRLFVIYPGGTRFPLHERVEAVGLERACSEGI